MTRLLLAAALLAALVGCGVPTAAPPPTIGPALTTARAPALPAAVSIPSIGVYSGLVPTGLNPDGTAEVPPINQPSQASYFEPGVIPGAPGPAVLYGHVSGRQNGVSVPGVFARIAELEPGDQIIVERHGAEPLAWHVISVGEYDKSAFPTDLVYSDTDGPELRLVTCGGEFDPGAGSYRSNVVAYAVPA